MRIRFAAWIVMTAVFAAPVSAQDRPVEPAAWQSLAATLQPGTLVEVRTKDGARFKGTFVQRSDDRVVVKPRTRVRVPARDIAYADLEIMQLVGSILGNTTLELIGVGVSAAVTALLGILVVAAAY